MLGFNSNATNWPLDFCKRNVLIFLFLVSLAVVVSWKDNDSRPARFLFFFFFFLTLRFQIWKKKVIFCSLLPPPRCVLGFQLKKKKKKIIWDAHVATSMVHVFWKNQHQLWLQIEVLVLDWESNWLHTSIVCDP